MIDIKVTLTRRVCEFQQTRTPKCQMCGKTRQLDLHHILRRSIYHHKHLAALMPLPFHALLCRNCNMNEGPYVADGPEGRATLLAQNAEIFGMEAIEVAFDEWDSIVPNGHDSNIVDLERVKEIYHELYIASKKCD